MRTDHVLGCLYVMTTKHYEPKSIFKIGFTTNLLRRIKTFNATRMDDDLFYCVRRWRTIHYSKLEAFLHNHLKEHRRKNEFFEVDISLIEEGVELFTKTQGPHFFHEDVVLINAQRYEVEYVSSQKLFIFTDCFSQIRHATENQMRPVIMEWLSCVDVYGLLKFMTTDAIDRLIIVLKQVCKQQQMEDLSAELGRLHISW